MGIALIVCLFLQILSGADAYTQSSPKNVLIILVDDGGFQSGVYGNDKCKTPHIDALANNSVIFEHAYTSVSSCSPSRSALLTGLPQHQNGMYGLHQTVHHFMSFDDVRSLPLILNETGGDIWYGIIGKKHVGPEYVYPFPFSYTEEDGYSLLQVGRNITYMKELMHKFLAMAQAKQKPFLLYMGFHDNHRCGSHGEYGPFCEHFGDGSPGMGVIPDWHPVDYGPDDVIVPYYIQDTTEARTDLASLYRAVSRLDQGVGLFIDALKEYGYDNNTLIIYSSDNGIPFPNGKTNLYDPGMGEPMLVSNPLAKQRWGQKSQAMAGLTDVVPTVLDWMNLTYPDYSLNGHHVTLQGKSLLPVTEKEPTTGWDTVFSSHDFHEITMNYPMRVVRNKQYKLIKNLNYKMPYPIATDIYSSSTFLDLLKHTKAGQPTKWFKTLTEYYYRDQWELYDIQNDPKELKNLAYDPSYLEVLTDMQNQLKNWRSVTADPWICYPQGVLEGSTCYDLDNDTA